jgi:hypothetical protein
MIFNERTRQALMEFEALEQEQIDWRNKLLIANLERDMARGWPSQFLGQTYP